MPTIASRPVRRVVVFGLGGTIAMTASPTDGVVPALSAEDLVAAVPGLAGVGVDMAVEDFRRLPGASLSMDDIAALAGAVRRRPEVDGVVMTQGTDTIEETAYLLDLLHPDDRPVIVTGAMRNPTLAGADGPANLLAAIQVAADPAAQGQGCLVVLADEIHAARRVRKTHSTAGGTFCSPNGGPLGYVVEGQPRFLNRLDHRTTVPTPVDTRPIRVGLVTVALGEDGALLDGLAERVDGVVVAAFGVGHVPENLVGRLDDLASRIPVVLASRTGAGPVLSGTYAFPGSERDLLDRGLISAGFLDPYKARILLLTLLAADAEPDMIRVAFAAAGGYAPSGTWPWPVTATPP